MRSRPGSRRLPSAARQKRSLLTTFGRRPGACCRCVLVRPWVALVDAIDLLKKPRHHTASQASATPPLTTSGFSPARARPRFPCLRLVVLRQLDLWGDGVGMTPAEARHDEFPHSTAKADGMLVVTAARELRNVYVHLNVPYAKKSGHTLHLQIIQPSRDATFAEASLVFAERFPCIVFVQGSAWGEQPLGSSMAFWCRFAEHGYTVAIVEYRPSSVAVFPAQVQDAKTAVRWLHSHADAYSIDPAWIVMAGDSSGGHTTLMVHATQDLPLFDDEPGEPLDIAAFVDFYGPTDLSRLNDEPTTIDLSLIHI